MKPYINVEKVNSQRGEIPPSWEFRKFISGTKMALKSGEVAVIYTKEQLDIIIDYFGEDELVISRNDVSNYWSCYLKNGRMW